MPEEKQDTALAVRSPEQSSKLTRLAAFTPVNLTEAMTLAKLIANSDLAPKEYRGKPGNVIIGMQYAAELGIPPVSGLQNISIINGRAALWGDLFLGIIQSSPEYEWHKEYFDGDGDNFGAVCIMKRKGNEPHTVKFSVHDAKIAKLWGKRGANGQDTPWITNPKRMLQMRSRGFCGRDKFSDALKGLIIAEEAMDLPPILQVENKPVDVDTFSSTITQSAEPNRGHGNEGMVLSPQAPSPNLDGMNQTEKKKDPEMCAECRAIGGHLPSCKYRISPKTDATAPSSPVEPKKEAAPTQTPTEQFEVKAVQIKTVKKSVKGKQERLDVEVISNDAPDPWVCYCYHKSLFDQLQGMDGQFCVLKLSKHRVQERDFYKIESIEETASPTAEQLGFEKTEEDF